MNVITKRFKVTQQIISQYANIIGDYNPIHTNPQFAKNTRFGKTLAHGMFGLGYLQQMIPQQKIVSNFQVKFKKPIFMNETIIAKLQIIEKKQNKQQNSFIYSLYGQSQNDLKTQVLGTIKSKYL